MGALVDALLNALGFAGNVVDTPGSAARGLLAGEPSRALGGILNPSQRVGGRELLEKYGALSQNQPGLDWGDVAGFGAEMATDPLNLLGLGAARATASAAKGARAFNRAQDSIQAAGGMPRALAEQTVLRNAMGPEVMYLPEIGPATRNAIYPRQLFRDPEAASQMALAGTQEMANPIEAASQIQSRVRPVYAYTNEMLTPGSRQATRLPVAREVIDDMGARMAAPRTANPYVQLTDDTQIFRPMIYDAPKRVPSTKPIVGAMAGSNVARGTRDR